VRKNYAEKNGQQHPVGSWIRVSSGGTAQAAILWGGIGFLISEGFAAGMPDA
jgi:hypothetical protein